MEKGCTSRIRLVGSKANVLAVPVALSAGMLEVADVPFKVRLVPVAVAGDNALLVVVAFVGFSAGAMPVAESESTLAELGELTAEPPVTAGDAAL